MPCVAREQRELMFEGGRSDERIRELQAIGQCVRIDKHHCPLRDHRRQGKNQRMLNGEPEFGALQLILAAAALGEFEISNR